MLDLSWEAKINRADELAAKGDAARDLLAFYGALLRLQKRVYDDLGATGAGCLREHFKKIYPQFAGSCLTCLKPSNV